MKYLVRILSLLPLSVLYWVADYLLYPVAYYLLRYRRYLVRINLKNAFPKFSEKEIIETEKKYFHHLADIIVEIIYSYRITDDEMQQRVKFQNVDKVAELAHQYGGVMMMLGHVGNWEWMAEIAHYLEPFGVECTNIYRKQKNESVNNLMLKMRKKHGGEYCDKNLILRSMVGNRRKPQPQAYGMIADQKPSLHGEHYTTTFLGQSTPFLIGSEVLSKKFNYPVVFLHIRQEKRGYYVSEFKLITEKPGNAEQYEITETYARMLEENILECPELWLWSHNRWRRKF